MLCTNSWGVPPCRGRRARVDPLSSWMASSPAREIASRRAGGDWMWRSPVESGLAGMGGEELRRAAFPLRVVDNAGAGREACGVNCAAAEGKAAEGWGMGAIQSCAQVEGSRGQRCTAGDYEGSAG